MDIKMIKRIIAAALCVLTLCIPSWTTAEQKIVIVANESVATDGIDKSDIKRIYFGKLKKWSNGDKIKPAQLRKGDASMQFASNYLNKSYKKYQMFWRRAVVAGVGAPPSYFNSPQELIDYVKSTPGAIGYVPAETDVSGVVALDIP